MIRKTNLLKFKSLVMCFYVENNSMITGIILVGIALNYKLCLILVFLMS